MAKLDVHGFLLYVNIMESQPKGLAILDKRNVGNMEGAFCQAKKRNFFLLIHKYLRAKQGVPGTLWDWFR
jgi:inorganic pyrophosphatase/exopolyphosphatase